MTSIGYKTEERSVVVNKRRLDSQQALPFLIVVTAGIICYGLFFRRGLGLSVIGYSLSPSERVMQGEVPYRDFLFNYTPGILWVNAALMKLFGVTLMTTRLGLLAFKILTLSALYFAARRLSAIAPITQAKAQTRVRTSWSALLPVALTLGWLGHVQVFNVYPDQYLILFALLGLILMLDYHQTHSKLRLFLCGVSVGVVFLFKQNVGLYSFAAGALAVMIGQAMSAASQSNSRRVFALASRFASYSAGFAVVTFSLVAYLVSTNAYSAMIEHFLHHAAEYSETRSVGLPPPRLLMPVTLALLVGVAGAIFVFRKAPRFFSSYLIGVLAIGSAVMLVPSRAYALKESAIAAVAYFPPLLFAAALLLGLWQLRGNFRNQVEREAWWHRNGALTITGLFALAVYLEVFPRADLYHLARVLPVVFLFLFVLIVRSLPALESYCSKHVPSPETSSRLLAAAPLVFLLLTGLLDTWWPQFDSSFRLKNRTELSIERGRGILVEMKQAELAEGLVGMIQENSSPDDYIFSFSQRGSSLYFLAGRRNPTRFPWWSSVGIKSEDRRAVMEMISEKRPKLIIVQDIPANKGLRDYFSSYYHQVGLVADIAVYDRSQ